MARIVQPGSDAGQPVSRRVCIGEIQVDPLLPIVVTESDGSVKRLGSLGAIVKASADLKGTVGALTSQMEAGDKVLESLRKERSELRSEMVGLRSKATLYNETVTARDKAVRERDNWKQNAEAAWAERDRHIQEKTEALAEVARLNLEIAQLRDLGPAATMHEAKAESGRAKQDLDAAKEIVELHGLVEFLKKENAKWQGFSDTHAILVAKHDIVIAERDEAVAELAKLWDGPPPATPDRDLSHVTSELVRHSDQIARLLEFAGQFRGFNHP